MREFKQVQDSLQGVHDLAAVDTLAYLSPFLDTIVSEDASGPLTGVALSSVNKFLCYGFLHPTVPRAREAVIAVARAATRCRFQSSSLREDETTLMQVLEILRNCLHSSAGYLLTDEVVWEMCGSAYRISRFAQASHLLHRSAESTLAHLVLTVFMRAPDIADMLETDPGAETAPVPSAFKADAPFWKTAGLARTDTIEGEVSPPPVASSWESSKMHSDPPYGQPVIAALLSWLSALTDPSHQDTTSRVLSLRLVNMVLEAAGADLGRLPLVVHVAQAELCRQLVQNSRTTEPAVLALTLRVVFSLFASMISHLKVPLEVFFVSVHLFLADTRDSPPEHRELALESLQEFARDGELMADIFVNYDCDVGCTNLFEIFTRTLARNATPQRGEGLNSLHVLALEGVLAVLESITRRCLAPMIRRQDSPLPMGEEVEDDDAASEASHAASTRLLNERRQLKRRLALAAARFNTQEGKHDTSDSGWIRYAMELDVLPMPPLLDEEEDVASSTCSGEEEDAPVLTIMEGNVSPKDVAHFLRHCPGLDKTLVGVYIAAPNDASKPKYVFQSAVRKQYIRSFDFAGMTVVQGLRTFLEAFRLPGEAQMIERLMEDFAEHFFQQAPGPFLHQDGIFILSYSIIMLNTDAHNEQVIKKMTLDAFVRNNRGINGGQDIPRDLLETVYNDIQAKPLALQADAAELAAAATADDASAAASSTAVAPAPSDKGALTKTGGTDEAASSQSLREQKLLAIGQHWDGVLRRQHRVGAFATGQAPAGAYEGEMLSVFGDAALTAISRACELTQSEETLRRALEGIRHLATSAAALGQQDLLDRATSAISSITRRAVQEASTLESWIIPAPVSLQASLVRARTIVNSRSRSPSSRQSRSSSREHFSRRDDVSSWADDSVARIQSSPRHIPASVATAAEAPPAMSIDTDALLSDSSSAIPRARSEPAIRERHTEVSRTRVDPETGLPWAPPSTSRGGFVFRRAVLSVRSFLQISSAHRALLRASWPLVVMTLNTLQAADALPSNLFSPLPSDKVVKTPEKVPGEPENAKRGVIDATFEDVDAPDGRRLPSCRFENTLFADREVIRAARALDASMRSAMVTWEAGRRSRGSSISEEVERPLALSPRINNQRWIQAVVVACAWVGGASPVALASSSMATRDRQFAASWVRFARRVAQERTTSRFVAELCGPATDVWSIPSDVRAWDELEQRVLLAMAGRKAMAPKDAVRNAATLAWLLGARSSGLDEKTVTLSGLSALSGTTQLDAVLHLIRAAETIASGDSMLQLGVQDEQGLHALAEALASAEWMAERKALEAVHSRVNPTGDPSSWDGLRLEHVEDLLEILEEDSDAVEDGFLPLSTVAGPSALEVRDRPALFSRLGALFFGPGEDQRRGARPVVNTAVAASIAAECNRPGHALHRLLAPGSGEPLESIQTKDDPPLPDDALGALIDALVNSSASSLTDVLRRVADIEAVRRDDPVKAGAMEASPLSASASVLAMEALANIVLKAGGSSRPDLWLGPVLALLAEVSRVASQVVAHVSHPVAEEKHIVVVDVPTAPEEVLPRAEACGGVWWPGDSLHEQSLEHHAHDDLSVGKVVDVLVQANRLSEGSVPSVPVPEALEAEILFALERIATISLLMAARTTARADPSSASSSKRNALVLTRLLHAFDEGSPIQEALRSALANPLEAAEMVVLVMSHSVLHLLSTLPSRVLSRVAPRVVGGVSMVMQGASQFVRSSSFWSVAWDLIARGRHSFFAVPSAWQTASVAADNVQAYGALSAARVVRFFAPFLGRGCDERCVAAAAAWVNTREQAVASTTAAGVGSPLKSPGPVFPTGAPLARLTPFYADIAGRALDRPMMELRRSIAWEAYRALERLVQGLGDGMLSPTAEEIEAWKQAWALVLEASVWGLRDAALHSARWYSLVEEVERGGDVEEEGLESEGRMLWGLAHDCLALVKAVMESLEVTAAKWKGQAEGGMSPCSPVLHVVSGLLRVGSDGSRSSPPHWWISHLPEGSTLSAEAVSLCCRATLSALRASPTDPMAGRLWLALVAALASDASGTAVDGVSPPESVVDAAREGLKNALMVMAAEGILDSCSKESTSERGHGTLWVATWASLRRANPELEPLFRAVIDPILHPPPPPIPTPPPEEEPHVSLVDEGAMEEASSTTSSAVAAAKESPKSIGETEFKPSVDEEVHEEEDEEVHEEVRHEKEGLEAPSPPASEAGDSEEDEGDGCSVM
jgi:hypothetical protein